jgi:hypothetical protein
MICETIKYTDYDGNDREEQFYFNLNQAECMKLELGTTGGLKKTIERIISEQDTVQIIKLFEEIVLKAYGEKSPDGKYFMKSPEIYAKFASTEAYSQLFMKLATDAAYATKFMEGVLPKNADIVPLNPNN